jgi:hypothetical protein
MKRSSAWFLTAALGALFAGCSTSSGTTAASVLAHTRNNVVFIASGHERDLRTASPTALDNVRVLEGAREAIPLPEPALPARDLLAGPTPQIPIPRSGSVACPLN